MKDEIKRKFNMDEILHPLSSAQVLPCETKGHTGKNGRGPFGSGKTIIIHQITMQCVYEMEGEQVVDACWINS